MGLLDLPAELRLEIYSKLLILPEPIEFVADYGPSLPPLFRSGRDGLHPAILRTNRKMYGEASPLLYSNNRFQFPEVFSSAPLAPTHAHVAPFLTQIRLQARHIRRICIPFPTFNYPVPETATLHQVHIDNLELIRKTCTDIETLELLIPTEHCNYALGDWAVATDALNILDTHFRSIRSLKEIIINFEEYPECDPDDDLTKKLHDIGWTVTITRLPKRVWISNDDRVEFDNEEDCMAYDNEQFRWELELEEQREKEEWLEEYYRRRRDPHWKNDSDYD
jgi:hypothetical protein